MMPTPLEQVALGILKRMGCTNVVTAEDGEAAVEAVQAAGGPDAFDVILMDLHMPRKVRLVSDRSRSSHGRAYAAQGGTSC